MITYMDRVVIATTGTTMREELGLDIATFAWALGAFRLAYSIFQLPGGWLGDRFGPRKALTLIVTWWSVFTSLTAYTFNAASLFACRFLFGMGEAGAFPIATRSLSRWILPAERGWAQGVTHAGSRLGAAFTPPLVTWLMVVYGWRVPFLVFGLIGIVWAAFWYLWYRDTPEEHSSVNEAELALIREGLGKKKQTPLNTKVPWSAIFSSRTLWVLSAMYFCYGWCLAIYLDWFPTYLKEFRGYDIKKMGYYAALPLLAGVFGDLLGGWWTDRWAEKTGNLKAARTTVGAIGFGLALAGILPATMTGDPELCVMYSCLAVFGIEVTVGVSWAVPLDIGGDFAGSVASVMNMFGNFGGTISTVALGYLVKSYGWNVPFYAGAGFCLLGGILYLGIDASRHIFASGGEAHEN